MPHIIIKATPFALNPNWKTAVGDKDSDPKLMATLDAVLDTQFKTFNRTSLSPRQVLDRLEDEGYKIVGVQTVIGQKDSEYGLVVDFGSQWTLHKPKMLSLYDFPM